MTETKQRRKPRKYTDEFKQQLQDFLLKSLKFSKPAAIITAHAK